MNNPGLEEWVILLIDDDEDDFLITREMLKGASSRKITLEWAVTPGTGLEWLRAKPYDAVLIDYDLGAENGISLIHQLVEEGCDLPLILFTGRGSYEIDLQAIEAGATLYLTKGDVGALTLERFIRYAIEKKRMDKELQESLRQKSAILESIQDGLFGLDQHWRFTFANTKAYDLMGVPAHPDLIGSSIWEVFPQLRGTVIEAHSYRAMLERQAGSFELYSPNLKKWFSISVYPAEGGITVYFRDITERKQAEDKLRKSEALFKKSFRSNPVSQAIVRAADSRMIDVNDSFVAITGYSREESIGRTGAELGLFSPPALQEKLKSHANPQGPMLNVEIQARVRSGELRTQLLSREPIVLEGEACFLLSGVDITDRKKSEEELHQAYAVLAGERNRLQAVMAALPVAVAILDAQGGHLDANQAYDELWGNPRPKADSIEDYAQYQAWWAETGKPVKPDEWASARAVKCGDTVKGQFIRIQKFDGKQAYILNSGAPFRDSQGQIAGSVVAILDITDRVQAEQALKETETRMEAALATLPVLIYECDRELRYTRVYKPLHGLTAETLIGKRDDDVFPAETARALIQVKRQALEFGEERMAEICLPGENRARRFLLIAKPFLDVEGAVVGLVCSAIDLTRYRRVAQAV